MAHDTMVHASTTRGGTTELDALVIGAGFAGLYQLLCLRDRLGSSVQALEAGGGLAAPGTGTATRARAATPKAMFIGTPSRLN
jgi:cation diffusion facilitator CzcD-associated flavoprotein CzcO